jgi:putative transposase
VSLDEARRRRSIRLRDFDYSQAGAYFVTICTKGRQLFFEEPIVHEIAVQCWEEIPNHCSNVELDEWVVMPNHVHGILVLTDGRGVQLNAPTQRRGNSLHSLISPRRHTLALVIRTYKAAVTVLSRRRRYRRFAWQRNYYEHVIRDELELNRIREYIHNNPQQWEFDENNPANLGTRAVGYIP